MQLGKVETEHESLTAAVKAVSTAVTNGEGLVVPTPSGVAFIPNRLLSLSVIKFRDSSDDKDIPF